MLHFHHCIYETIRNLSLLRYQFHIAEVSVGLVGNNCSRAGVRLLLLIYGIVHTVQAIKLFPKFQFYKGWPLCFMGRGSHYPWGECVRNVCKD